MSELWERQTWDTAASFRSFNYYLAQKPPRSVDESYRLWLADKYPHKRPINATKRAAKAWRAWSRGQTPKGIPIPDTKTWQQRAAAYDDYLAALDRQLWESRRLQVKEDDWRQSGTLRKVADQILAEAPKFTRTQRQRIPAEYDAQGRQISPEREIITLALNGQLAVRAAETASKLARLAAEMETERKQIEIIKQELNAMLSILESLLSPEDYQRVLEALAVQGE